MGQPKVFAIGFNKTATTSLTSILQQFGLKTLHHGTWHHWIRDKKFSNFSRYDAFTDGQQKDFRLLDNLYPGSKFILNTRPLKDWLISRWCHVQVNKTTNRSRWQNNDPEHVAAWALERDDYHMDVLDYFKNRKNDFVLLDLQTMSPNQIDTTLKHLLSDIANTIPASPLTIPKLNSSNSTLRSKGKLVINDSLKSIGMPAAQWDTNTYTQYYSENKYPAHIKESFYTSRTPKEIWYKHYRREHLI